MSASRRTLLLYHCCIGSASCSKVAVYCLYTSHHIQPLPLHEMGVWQSSLYTDNLLP